MQPQDTAPTKPRFQKKDHCCQDVPQPPPKTDYNTTYSTFHNGMMPKKSAQVAVSLKSKAQKAAPVSADPLGTTEYRDEYYRKREKPFKEVDIAPKTFADTGSTYGPTFMAQKDLPPLRKDPSMKHMAALPVTTNHHFFYPKLNQLRPSMSTPTLKAPQMGFRGATTYDTHFIEHPIRPRMDRIYNYHNRCEQVRRAKELL